MTLEDNKNLEIFKNKLSLIHNLAELSVIKSNGINLGEHARAATIRFFATVDLKEDVKTIKIFKSFLIAAEKTRLISLSALKKYSPDVCFLIHGLYIPHGVMNDVFKSKNVRTIIWNKGYRKNTYIFSNNETYHKSLLEETKSNYSNVQLDEPKKSWIIRYLASRKYGHQDWVTFVRKPKFEVNQKDPKYRKRFILLTNVTWDAQIHYKQNVFNSMLEWINITIDWFKDHKEYELIIRAHPAEVNSIYPSTDKITELIRNNNLDLPGNVSLIDSSDTTSTYNLIDSSY
jgi:hypothetical protein